MSDDDIDNQIASLEGRLNSAGISTEPPEEQPKTIFDNESDKELTSDLGKIFDRAEGKTEAALMARDVPSARADSFDEAFEKTFDYLNATEAERAVTRDASKLVEQVKNNAKKFGVELSEPDALKMAFELEQQQAKVAPAEIDAIRQLYPDRDSREVATQYAALDREFQRDPVGTAFRALEQRGIHPLEAARQIAAQHSPAHVQQFYAERDTQAAVEHFFELMPDAARLQDKMLAAIEKGPKSGSVMSRLQAAYRIARGGKGKSRSGKTDFSDEMAQVYDRSVPK